MRFKNYLLLLLLSFFVSTTYAQNLAKANDEKNCTAGWENGWCWGSDPGTAKEKNALYTDALDMKDFKTAVAPLEWLLSNTPNLNKSIYINGEKIYRTLEKTAQGEEKIALQDKLLKLFDDRIKYFGQEKTVIQKKGTKLYGFMIKRDDAKDKYEEYLTFYEKIHELCGVKTKRSNLIYNMDFVYRLGKMKKLTEDQIIEKYEKIAETVEVNTEKATGDKKARWESTKKKIDAKFENVVSIDCDFVRSRWGERLTSTPDDIKLAKKTIRYMLQGKCTDDPLFFTAVENVHANEPTIQTGNILYKKYLAEEKYDVARKYIDEVIELSGESPDDQGKAYMALAKMIKQEGKYVEARTQFMKAVEIDNSLSGDAYTQIGNMYMSSRKACLAKSDPNPVKDRAVYFAAYAMYQKAGNSSGMARAAAQFPSMSEIFQYNYKVGDIIGVDCWVGGSYAIQKRP
ncbi:MAG: tetratricopeptide repeat protein [Flammeovirgaceae bacterium]